MFCLLQVLWEKHFNFSSIVICGLVILEMAFSEERSLSEISLQEKERRFKKLAKILGKFRKTYLSNLSENKRMVNEKKY